MDVRDETEVKGGAAAKPPLFERRAATSASAALDNRSEDDSARAESGSADSPDSLMDEQDNGGPKGGMGDPNTRASLSLRSRRDGRLRAERLWSGRAHQDQGEVY